MLMVQDDLRLNCRYMRAIWCWARNMSQVQVKQCLNGIIGQRNQETLSDWSSYIREILINCLNDAQAQPISGHGTVVQLDEAYMHGRRKNHVGRLMRGNRVALARQNNGNRTLEPWDFGLAIKHANGNTEVRRPLHVLRRDERTP